MNPIFWLVLSFLLVTVSLTAVLVVLVPTVVELSRAARSVEKLCDTINRDLPPTLEAIRQMSVEINRLTEDVNTGVQSAGRVAQQVDHSVNTVRGQAKRAEVGTRSLIAGVGAAWSTLIKPPAPSDRPNASQRRPVPASPKTPFNQPTSAYPAAKPAPPYQENPEETEAASAIKQTIETTAPPDGKAESK